jgi:hypothetical protein
MWLAAPERVWVQHNVYRINERVIRFQLLQQQD